MSIKIRISYQAPEELELILELLHPVAASCRVPKVQRGKFKNAYVTAGCILDGPAGKGKPDKTWHGNGRE